MTHRFLNVFSVHKMSEPMNGTTSFAPSRIYNEEAFRYLLESESKRSERSGFSYQILLVYSTDAYQRIAKMDSPVAETVMAGLSHGLRETDYVGWYREGLVAGGVLTVVGREAATDQFSRLQQRLEEFLRDELGGEEAGRLRIRVYHHQELEGIELGEETCAAK